MDFVLLPPRKAYPQANLRLPCPHNRSGGHLPVITVTDGLKQNEMGRLEQTRSANASH